MRESNLPGRINALNKGKGRAVCSNKLFIVCTLILLVHGIVYHKIFGS